MIIPFLNASKGKKYSLTPVLNFIEGPIKQLKRFKRITLKPGEKSSVKFRLHPADMGVLDRNMKKVVEQGIFKLFLGSSSQDIRLSGEFKIARTIKVVK